MKRLLAFSLALLIPAAHAAHAEWGEFDNEFDTEQPWTEVVAQLPAAPQAAHLRAFTVSAVAPHRYLLDTASISSGKDGVVRFTVVIESAGGVRNVSFEGMRCETFEHRLYAIGQPDGSWTRARDSAWQSIKLRSALSYRKALFEDVLCRNGLAVRSAAEAVANLTPGWQ